MPKEYIHEQSRILQLTRFLNLAIQHFTANQTCDFLVLPFLFYVTILAFELLIPRTEREVMESLKKRHFCMYASF